MTGVEENYPAQRLLAAATAAFGPLASYGFGVTREPNPQDLRGASVEVGSATVTFTIDADWWDRELVVWVAVAGAETNSVPPAQPPSAIPVEALVPELRRIRRLPRSPTRGVLQSRLERVVQVLQEQAPDVLVGDGRALERILRTGAQAEDA